MLSKSKRAPATANGEPPLYQNVLEGVFQLKQLLGGGPSEVAALQLIDALLDAPHTRTILYVGAGVSRSVRVEPPTGHGAFTFPTWDELLQRVAAGLPRHKREPLMETLRTSRYTEEASGRDLGLEELLAGVANPHLAWLLSTLFEDRKDLDALINSLVSPPKGSSLTSDLVEELLAMRMDDIITTNYDSSISTFLKRLRISFVEFAVAEDLAKRTVSRGDKRVFYIHGKAGEGPIVFDRFDYARLLSQPDSILHYIAFLLRDSHVVYVGFGLDDPSFDLLDVRLSAHLGEHRPWSFAFLPTIPPPTREAWRNHRIRVIEYGTHNKLPELLSCVNRIVEYVNWAEPDRPRKVDGEQDRTDSYLTPALKSYLSGDYTLSIQNSRAALASTLFWPRSEEPGDKRLWALTFERAARLCLVRIRLGLCHYKLQWEPHRREHHKTRTAENIRDAKSLVKRLRETSCTPKHELPVTALENSTAVLEGRLLYHAGDFPQAKKLFLGVCTVGTCELMQIDPAHDDPSSVIWKLSLAESYYYAHTQSSRIEYQVPSSRLSAGVESGERESMKLRKLVDQLDGFLGFLDETREKCKPKYPEWSYYKDSLETIRRALDWTAGRHKVRIWQDVLPTRNERTKEALVALNTGIGLLEDRGSESMGLWAGSARWQVMRRRYLSRGLAQRWLLRRFLEGRELHGDADLVRSYGELREGFRILSGPGLERQKMIWLLDAARLNILAMFGDRLECVESHAQVGAMNFAAAINYLDDAFLLMDDDEGVKDRWLRTSGYRLASYLPLLAAPRMKEGSPAVRSPGLKAHLELSAAERVERVRSLFLEFAAEDSKKLLDSRIEAFTTTHEKILRELNNTSTTEE